MAECNHDCSACSSKCGEATSLLAPQNAGSNVKRVIGVVSGKGGVGKSLVTGLMATLMKRRGYSTAVLDADITGPSIPKMFGLTDKAKAVTTAFSRWKARRACGSCPSICCWKMTRIP